MKHCILVDSLLTSILRWHFEANVYFSMRTGSDFSLEPPRQGVSNEGSKHMFYGEIIQQVLVEGLLLQHIHVLS